ncbi:MAG: hypothetical protein DCF16_09600 [Alphaproteobacteria bacterium]|nr:MAG: hypothetical protein DCF16_09600 [Alphaproteobacteria bacterium]
MQSRPALPPLPSEHKLTRLQTWTKLTLLWAVAHVLGVIAPDIARGFLARMKRNASVLLIARAILRMRMPLHSPRAHVHLLGPRRDVTNRRILGAAFRRAIRARGLVAQARALAAILDNAEAWIARIARRRLSRLIRRPRMRQAAPLHVVAIAAARTFANTS